MSSKQPGYPRTAEDDLFICVLVVLFFVVVYAIAIVVSPGFSLWTMGLRKMAGLP